MKFNLLTYMVFSLVLVSCASIKQKKENIQSFKEMAFCNCLLQNYRDVDSTFRPNDLSLSVIFSGRSLSKEVWDSLSVYSGGKTLGAYSGMSHTTTEYEGSNFIALSCLNFYNSKELEKYIKRLMKKDQ